MKKITSGFIFWTFLSILSSTLLIFYLKIIDNRLRCQYVATLTSYHFITTWFFLELLSFMGYIRRILTIPIWKRIFLTLLSFFSIYFMNLSLEKNSLSFYLLAKLFCIPFIILHNILFRKMKYTSNEIISLSIIFFGIFIFSFSDVEFNFMGSIYALFGIIFTVYCQMFIGDFIKEYSLTGSELQLVISPYQFIISCLFSYFFESNGFDSFILNDFPLVDLFIILITCILSFFVNISTYNIISSSSNISFQVIGQFKIIILLIIGLYFFPTHWETTFQMIRAIIGIIFAIIGTFLYVKARKISFISTNKEELNPLLNKN